MTLQSLDDGAALQRATASVNRLTAQWASTLAGRSTALSAASVWPLLGWLAGASTGRARADLERALGLPAEAAAAAANALAAGLDRLTGVRLSCACWRPATVPLAPWWTEHVPDAVSLQWPADGGAQEAARAWVRSAAGGRLQDVDVPWASPDAVALTAALTVEAGWTHRFRGTRMLPLRGPWRGRPLTALTRQRRRVDDVGVVGTGPTALTLVRLGTEQSVDVYLVAGACGAAPDDVLPAAVTAVAEVAQAEAALADELPWRVPEPGERAPGLRVRRVRRPQDSTTTITVPRFAVRARHDLLSLPGLVGLEAARAADGHYFPGLTPVPLAVTSAGQDVVAELTADGFHTAALSAVVMRVTSAPPRGGIRVHARFDRPFGWVVVHPASGLVLAAGWVADTQSLQMSPSRTA